MNLIKQIEEITDKCISCGFCESVCPTLEPDGYNSVFGARGRVILADFALKENSEGLELGNSFYSCLDCYACVNVCPAGVNAGVVSELMRELVASGNKGKKNPVAEMIKSSIMEYGIIPIWLKCRAHTFTESTAYAFICNFLYLLNQVHKISSPCSVYCSGQMLSLSFSLLQACIGNFVAYTPHKAAHFFLFQFHAQQKPIRCAL